MQRRVAVSERPAVRDVLTGVQGAFVSGASALAVPGGQMDNVVAERTDAPLGPVSGMSYAVALGSGTRPEAQGPSKRLRRTSGDCDERSGTSTGLRGLSHAG
ncbi:hypothetical protein MRX96_020686 [Rhipicephalus microplus]